MKESDLESFIQMTEHKANKFSKKWWGAIADENDFDPYTDYDQYELDDIFSNYNKAIFLLQVDNTRLREVHDEPRD